MKSSAGAANYLPVCRVANLANTIDVLKQAGYWIAGADMEGDPVFSQDLTGPIGLVIGSEGSGLSRLVKEKCDFLISVPMRGRINSLNASVAAALLMFEAVRQRGMLS
jgi:23S rRNA (guanosine2251-2'-O)-methyltransferase